MIAQIVVMTAVFAVTWLGLAIIGIPGSFILGIQAGLLAFIPTVGAIVAGVIVVLASLSSGWIATASAFGLFLGVHALESYILTPILQRQALDIPPATLFAFQILLGIVFGLWGISLALPLMAIVKVLIDHFKAEEPMKEQHQLNFSPPRFRCARPRARSQILADQPAPGLKVFRTAEIDGVVLQRFPFDEQPVAGRLFDRFVELHTLTALARRKSGLALATAASKSFSVPGLTSIWAISVTIVVPLDWGGMSLTEPAEKKRGARESRPCIHFKRRTVPTTIMAQPMNMIAGHLFDLAL